MLPEWPDTIVREWLCVNQFRNEGLSDYNMVEVLPRPTPLITNAIRTDEIDLTRVLFPYEPFGNLT